MSIAREGTDYTCKKRMQAGRPEERKCPKRNPDPKECLYHSDPASFQSVMKHLGCTLQIPSALLKRSAMAICSCRSSRTSSKRQSAAELQVLLASSEITDEILLSRLTEKTQQGKLPPYETNLITIEYVKKALHDARTHGKESQVRFTALLKNAFKQDLSLLQKEYEIGKRQPVKAKKPNEKAAPPFVMIRKRKKQTDSAFTLTLPMFGGNATRLQSEDSIGQKFRKITVKYKPCVVEIDYEATGAAMVQNLQKTIVKIWCNKENYYSIQNHLITTARALQSNITHAYEEQKRVSRLYRNAMRFRHEIPQSRVLSSFMARLTDPQLIKEVKRDDFSKKHHADKQSKIKTKHQREDILLKCIQCHTTFHKFSIGQNKPTERSPRDETPETDLAHSQCRYHPGFLTGKLRQWSCCMQSTPDDLQHADMSTIHYMSGCSNNQYHVWRYDRVKKTNKKSKLNRTDHACLSL